MTAAVKLDKVSMAYGNNQVLTDFDLEVATGEFMAILGPSGCGKSTLLNLIAGFLHPTAGHITIRGRDVTGVPAHRRNLSMVFQNYALFPHMTVFENIAYGLKARRTPRAVIADRVARMLEIAGLDGLADRYPRQLSGGQQQRVALARAMAVEPDVLLLDEPLSNLDAKLRREMRLEIKQLQRRLSTTTILVTHDQDEALSLADRVAVLYGGRVQQLASPLAVYQSPASPFVAEFVGRTNSFHGTVVRAADDAGTVLDCGDGLVLRLAKGADAAPGAAMMGVVRPEFVEVLPGSADSATDSSTAAVDGRQPELVGVLAHRAFVGTNWECGIRLACGAEINALVRAGGSWVPQENEPVRVTWDLDRLILLAREEP